ncbi:MAG TPA: cytidine deaminase [Ktedonobacteraceae bacterium]|nr:cytidine deaminase [Ktedonobacteraceae bacterium]
MYTREELLGLVREVALRAHCPYSHFRVGAAVAAGGKIYTGVNIEISSYGLTLCAERSALAAAISAGAGPITQIAVACLDVSPQAPLNERAPCGACRQWIADLAPGAVIYIDGDTRNFTIDDLLPHAFGLQASRPENQSSSDA